MTAPADEPKKRKLVAWLFMSVDGVVEAPDQWLPEFDDDMGAAMAATIHAQDAVLLGRVTYEEWASYWPTAQDEPFASFINSTRKHVVSSSLTGELKWAGSTLIRGGLVETIHAMKAQGGKDIGVHGSPSLVRSLVEADLLDELRLMFASVVAGRGKRLFGPLEAPKRLKLIESKATRSGTLLVTYQCGMK